MLGAGLAGFVAPWLPEGLGILKSWMAGRHEMKMLELQYNRYAAEAETLRYRDEADIAAFKAVARSPIAERKPRESFGVKLLDAAAKRKNIVPTWVLSVAFSAFAVLDWIISSVRPIVAYFVIGTWLLVAWRVHGVWAEVVQALHLTDLVFMIAGFYFGERTRRRATAERLGR